MRSNDSERPESSFASQDVSIIPWTDCYPDDPDKARELTASTGVPGLQVYPADTFTNVTVDSQVFNAVDTSQNSDNSRAEMETQISPGHAEDSETEHQTPIKTRHRWNSDDLLESDIECTKLPSSDGVPRAKAEKQTGEQSKMPQGGVRNNIPVQQQSPCSDVNTGLPPMTKESWRELGKLGSSSSGRTSTSGEGDTGR